MTPQQLLGLGLRFAAIWVVMLPFQLFAITVALFDFINEPAPIVWLGLSLVPGLLGVFLWFFPMLVAHKLLPHRGETGNLATMRDVTAALGVVVGAFAVLNAVPYIYSGACIALAAPDADITRQYFDTDFGPKFIVGLGQYALGLILILMPRFVAGLIFPDRSATAAGAPH